MRPEDFSRERRTLIDQLIALIVDLFGALGSWQPADGERFLDEAVPALEGGQQTLAALTATYLAAEAIGAEAAPPGVPDAEAVGLRGVDPREVYRRPFTTVYTHLGRGEPLEIAVEHGANRLAGMVEADLQQTYAHAARSALESLAEEGASARFWRRTLVGPDNCGLCVIASTQRYRTEDLNPVHPGCDCRVDPIPGPDPGQVIEPELLEQVHDAVAELTGKADRGGRAVDYRQLMVTMTREHGELGPMLVRPRDRFTSAGDL